MIKKLNDNINRQSIDHTKFTYGHSMSKNVYVKFNELSLC